MNEETKDKNNEQIIEENKEQLEIFKKEFPQLLDTFKD